MTCSPCAQRPSEAPLLAHRVDSLRCEGSDAIGAKRTRRERRKRVDPTKMTHNRPPMCSATGWPVAEELAYPVTDPRRFDTLHSALTAGEIECNLII